MKARTREDIQEEISNIHIFLDSLESHALLVQARQWWGQKRPQELHKELDALRASEASQTH